MKGMKNEEAIRIARAQLQQALKCIENAERAMFAADRVWFAAALFDVERGGMRVNDAMEILDGLDEEAS